MKVTVIAAVWALTTGSSQSSFASRDNITTEAEAQAQVTDLIANITTNFFDAFNSGSSLSPASSNCTSSNIVTRKEYGSLSEAERLSYINAVKCLQRLPPRTPSSATAGAKSRFDDFVAVHINQTLTIHCSGNFMPWHRWFVHLYETALREECNYTGYQPYWDWPKYQDSPLTSPVFYGPYSLGNNGDYTVHNGTVITAPDGVSGGDIQLPAGVGGGYVTTGPFTNMTVNLGPVDGTFGTEPGPDGGLGFNPRVLKRDLGPAMNQRYCNYTTVLNLLEKDNITNYRLISEGGGDLCTSPRDPAFWAHHGQMDRLWTLWQARDNGTYGRRTWANDPASDLTGLDDVMTWATRGRRRRSGTS